ncbi:hypothetical protein [Haladaptatus sp. DYSN1]|uniref:hypothetical protein n=2 Tax=Haladaptatus TaxID=367188 RepID=UPI002406E239|nr:hypothetical protein [Haladaptatus sp. DYSN1]
MTGTSRAALSQREGKAQSTLYSDDRVKAARNNVAQFSWARSRRDSAVEDAEDYLAVFNTDEALWSLVTTQDVPRSTHVTPPPPDTPLNDAHISERVTDALWGTSTIRSPWELVDSTSEVQREDLFFPGKSAWELIEPATGRTFPTNDFQTYYDSGVDEFGNFDATLADESLLKNKRYPEKGEDWGVDDGTGWVDEAGELGKAGTRYHFVAFYNRVYRWQTIFDMLVAFRDAYVFTGEQKYAHAGAILLDRIADVYPDMDVSVYGYDDGFVANHGWTGQGKIFGCRSEAVAVKTLLTAYDAFYPSQPADDRLVEFLARKASEYQLGEKDSLEKVRANIETNIVEEVLPAVERHQIYGRPASHLTALALSAVVADSPGGYTTTALNFLFSTGEISHEPDGSYWGQWRISGGNLMELLLETIDRDGHADGTPQYNQALAHALQQLTRILEDYPGYDGPKLTENVKMKRLLENQIPLVLREQYIPNSGNDGRPGKPKLGLRTDSSVAAFEAYEDPVFAKAAFLANGYAFDGMHGDIFSVDPARVGESIQAHIAASGPLELSSTNVPSFGFAALRDGEHYIQGGLRVVDQFPEMPVVEKTVGYKIYSGSGTLQLEANEAGHRITFEFSVPATDTYEVSLKPFEATSYGRYEVSIDREVLTEYDFYTPETGVKPFRVLESGVELSEGTHELTFQNMGKNDASSNYKMGVITCRFLNEAAVRERELKEERGNTQRSFSLTYGRTTDGGSGIHRTHRDMLSVGVHAYGLDLAPDLGYPERTERWPEPSSPDERPQWPQRIHWTENTASNNTVVVDGEPQEDGATGFPRHFVETKRVSLIDVSAPTVYPGVNSYRRVTAMVNVDESNSYAVDFFHVSGGDEHVWSFHGPAGEVEANGVTLSAQQSGTYAGPAIDAPGRGETTAYDEQAGDGFNYLSNVERTANPPEQLSFDWHARDTWGVTAETEETDIHLRTTLLGKVAEVALADGPTPLLPGNPPTLRYGLAKRTGTDLESVFTSIVEPYRESRYITDISAVPVELAEDGATEEKTQSHARAMKVVLKSGRADYVVFTGDPDSMYVVDGRIRVKAFFAHLSVKDGEAQGATVVDGTHLAMQSSETDGPLVQRPYGQRRGRVEGFTTDLAFQNKLVVKLDGDISASELTGNWVYVTQSDGSEEAYEIRDATELGGSRVALDVGEQTFVDGTTESAEATDYQYAVEEGAEVTIPLSWQWKRKS